MAVSAPYPLTHARLCEFIAKGRNKHSRPIANHTYVALTPAGAVALVFHSTAILTFHADDTVTMYNGGWNTQTTADRLRTYSPVRPYRDGKGSLIIGSTGELTPPNVRKCRARGGYGAVKACKGEGTIHYARTCHVMDGYWDPSNVCPGGKVDTQWSDGYRRRIRVPHPCTHGKLARHPTAPCEHGKWQDHALPVCVEKCYRCNGTGQYDYGSRPVPILWDGSPIRLSASGDVIAQHDDYHPVAPSKYVPFNGTYVAPKPKSVPEGSVMGQQLAAIMPDFARVIVQCPHAGCLARPSTIQAMIIHLNDLHQWTREQIADWLDTLDADLRFPA